MKIFADDNGEKIVYAQLQDLEYLKNGKCFWSEWNFKKDLERERFVEVSCEKTIQKISEAQWIIDVGTYMQWPLRKLQDEIVFLENAREIQFQKIVNNEVSSEEDINKTLTIYRNLDYEI